MIARSFPNFTDNRTLRGIIIFSRWYVSLCSPETIYTMALTGDNYRKSALNYRKNLFIGENNVYTIIRKIQHLFLLLGKLCISLSSWAVFRVIVLCVDSIDQNHYIWISIISFLVGYLIAAIVTDISKDIMDTILFCQQYESVCSAGRQAFETDELR